MIKRDAYYYCCSVEFCWCAKGREKAGNGVGGCAGFRSGVVAEVLFNICSVVALQKISGLSLRARGQGFPPVTMSVVSGYFHRKMEAKFK